MRRSAVLVLPLLLAACGDNQDEAGAKELLERVRGESYQTWARAPGWDRRLPTSAPHAEEVDIFLNPTLYDAAVGGAIDAWPVGSIVVKDGYDGRDLAIIAIMEKREDGWFFAEYDEDGDPFFSGQPQTCLDCHEAKNDRILAFDLPE